MRLVCISDTHSMHRQIERVPDGDVLIHAGDSLGVGKVQELEELNDWFGELPHKHKILVAGNHDWCLESSEVPELFLTNAKYLEDSGTEIDGIRFWGSPWTVPFYSWAFQLSTEERSKKWALIPQKTDVLITHGPASGIFDFVPDAGHVGCEELMKRIDQLRLKAHICGHIHEGAGFGVRERDGLKFANASICDERYRPINPPIIIDL